MSKHLVNLLEPIEKIKDTIRKLEEQMESEIKSIKQKYEPTINDYKKALKVLREINEICEYCDGRGGTTLASAAGHNDGKWVKCEYCNGTGRSNYGKTNKKE